MVMVAQEQEQNQKEDYDKCKKNVEKNRGVTISNIGEDNNADYDSRPSGSKQLNFSSNEDKGYVTDGTVCVNSQSESSDVGRIVEENDRGSRGSSITQYSEVDDSLEGDLDEFGSWSNDLNVPVSLEQNFDNGVSLPISEVPNFGDVCVKNSSNVHFGNKTFYNGPVTIKQIVYANPNLSEDNFNENIDNNVSDDKIPKGNSTTFGKNGFRTSGRDNNKSANPEDLQNVKVTECCALLLTWRCVALMCAMGSCLVAAIVVSVVLLSRDSELPVTPTFPEIPDSSIDANGPPLEKLRFVERTEWGAQPPTEPLTKLKHPVPYVIISHTATDFCKTQSECTFHVRFAQTFHIESRNWSDIAYNFLIGGDSYAYVGRSWDYVGAHSYNYNTRSIGISFIGTFNTVVPPKNQLLAAQQLIELGVKGGKISTDYKLLGHRQISKTLSPGEALYNVIKTWPHWSPFP